MALGLVFVHDSSGIVHTGQTLALRLPRFEAAAWLNLEIDRQFKSRKGKVVTCNINVALFPCGNCKILIRFCGREQPGSSAQTLMSFQKDAIRGTRFPGLAAYRIHCDRL